MREDAVKFYETQGSKGHQYAICESGSDVMIGNIAIMLNENRGFEANIGYWMGKNHRNKGYMTAALVKIIEIIKSELNIRRIVATHDVSNPASGRVMQKAGMTYEGTLKSYYQKNGMFVDECIYAYINEDVQYD
jgi:ribosomal-protein-alanine N-acetyltransferase